MSPHTRGSQTLGSGRNSSYNNSSNFQNGGSGGASAAHHSTGTAPPQQRPDNNNNPREFTAFRYQAPKAAALGFRSLEDLVVWRDPAAAASAANSGLNGFIPSSISTRKAHGIPPPPQRFSPLELEIPSMMESESSSNSNDYSERLLEYDCKPPPLNKPTPPTECVVDSSWQDWAYEGDLRNRTAVEAPTTSANPGAMGTYSTLDEEYAAAARRLRRLDGEYPNDQYYNSGIPNGVGSVNTDPQASAYDRISDLSSSHFGGPYGSRRHFSHHQQDLCDSTITGHASLATSLPTRAGVGDDDYSAFSNSFHQYRVHQPTPTNQHHRNSNSNHQSYQTQQQQHYPSQGSSGMYKTGIVEAPSVASSRASYPAVASANASAASSSTIEVAPGMYLRLRGAAETWHAIQNDFYMPCACSCCSNTIFCIQDADYILCPDCRVISPACDVPTNGGVGLGFKYEQLAQWQEEIAAGLRAGRR